MRDEIESLINDRLNEVELTNEDNLDLVKQIEDKINSQNTSIEEQNKRREVIKGFLKSNNITSLDELSEEQIKNILNYKI